MIKTVEKLVKLRDRLYELQLALDYVRREIDGVANDMVDTLEQQETTDNDSQEAG
jgi:hypothetical protein